MLDWLIPTAYAKIATASDAARFAGPAAKKPQADPFAGFLTMLYDAAWTLLLCVILAILAYAALKLVRVAYEIFTSRELVRVRVLLPRADSKLDKEKETKKDFKEKIGIMSVFYKAVHKMGDMTLKETLMNFVFDHAKVSFELVYDQGLVYFYVVTYRRFLTLVSQQLTSNYPDAELTVIDPKDYVDMKPRGHTLRCASVYKIHDDFLPVKTFKYFEDDPLNNFTNVFGSLGKDDRALYQIVAKPLGSGWNKRAKKMASLMAKGKFKRGSNAGLIGLVWNVLISPVAWLFNLFATGSENGNMAPGATSGDAYTIFSAAETDAQKMTSENAGQPAWVASIRVMVSSPTPQTALDGRNTILSSAAIFTDEYTNKLDNPQFVEDAFSFFFTPVRYLGYLFRFVGFFQHKTVYSTDELSTMLHFPDIKYNTSPIIQWLDYKKVSPPSNLRKPTDALMMPDFVRKDGHIVAEDGTLLRMDKNGNLLKDEAGRPVAQDGTPVELEADGERKGQPVDAGKAPKRVVQHRHLAGFPLYKDASLMGWNEYRNRKTPIYFSKKDRGRHHYIIGKSGGGKSVFIGYMARQDLWNGDGLCIVDPHGDLVEDVLSFTPKERAKDMVVFDPADYERPMGLNMLEIISQDPAQRAIEKDRAALDATSIFIKIFNEEIFGPRIQHYFRNGCLTLMDDEEDGGTLIDVPRLFVDDAFMKYKTSKVKNPVVKAFWEHEYANTGDREKQEMIPYFSSKFGPFITNTTIRNIIGQPKSAFNIRQLMDGQKALMVNLSKGKIGDLNAQLLGLIFVSKINMAAMSRADTPEKDRKDFFLYVDEFQNFATDTFGEILSEARKYKLALIMAHQFIAQIGGSKGGDGKPSIKDAVFGNAGTIMSFKVGADDAEYLEKEYAPVLSQQDIIGIANFTTYCKLNIDNATTRPFDVKTIWDNTYQNRETAKIIKEYSRKMYGRKKEFVDQEIEARLGIKSA